MPPDDVVDNQPELKFSTDEPYELLKVWYHVHETEEKYCILYVYEWDESWPWWEPTGYTYHAWDYEPIIYCRDKSSGEVTWIYDAGHYDAGTTTDTNVFDVTEGSHQYSPNTSAEDGETQSASKFEELTIDQLLDWERKLIDIDRYGTGQLSLLEAFIDPCAVEDSDQFGTPSEGEVEVETETYELSGDFTYMTTGLNYWYVTYCLENKADRPITSLKFCFDGEPDVDDIRIYDDGSHLWHWEVEDKCLRVWLEEGYAAKHGIAEGETLCFFLDSNWGSDLGVGDVAVNRGNDHDYEDDEENAQIPGPVAARETSMGPAGALAALEEGSFASVLGPGAQRYLGSIPDKRARFDPTLLLDEQAREHYSSIEMLSEAPVSVVHGIGESRAEALEVLFGIETVGDLARLASHPLTRLGMAIRALRAADQVDPGGGRTPSKEET